MKLGIRDRIRLKNGTEGFVVSINKIPVSDGQLYEFTYTLTNTGVRNRPTYYRATSNDIEEIIEVSADHTITPIYHYSIEKNEITKKLLYGMEDEGAYCLYSEDGQRHSRGSVLLSQIGVKNKQDAIFLTEENDDFVRQIYLKYYEEQIIKKEKELKKLYRLIECCKR